VARAYRFTLVLNLLGIGAGLVMYFFLGRLVESATAPALGAYATTYFPFVLVGLAFFNCLSVGMDSFLDAVRTEQRSGTLEALLVSPAPTALVLAGGIVWPLLLALVYVVVYLAGGALLFGADWSRADWPSIAVLLLLTLAQAGGLGLLLAGLVLIVKRGESALTFLSAALGLLIGVYYPVEVLPEPLRTVAAWLPLTRTLHALRRAAFEGVPLLTLWPDLLYLAATTLLLLVVGRRWLAFALAQARRDGSLGHF
jgi:ABC-2 type transport system permease protein